MSETSFWSWARQTPDRVALVEPNGAQYTFAELEAWVNELSHGLRAQGLKTGDAIAVQLPSVAAVFALHMAAHQVGLYYTPISYRLTGPETAYIVENSESKLFIGHQTCLDAARWALDHLDFPPEQRFGIGEMPGFRALEELAAGQPATAPEDRKAGSVMVYTSGTTGRPKGVRRPLPPMDPDTIGGMLASFQLQFGVQPGEGVHLVVAPLYHAGPLSFATGAMHLGLQVVVMERWTPELCLEYIERYRVTTTHIVPTMFHRMLALPDEVRARFDVSSVANIVHSAAPCPIPIKQQMLQWWGPTIYEYYAATEGGGTTATPEQWLAHPGTVGQAWPGSTLKIFDDDGNELPPGEPGTVYMHFEWGQFEYFKDQKKTNDSYCGDMFTVGDIGYLDREGWLFLCDRKSDMIISGGVNIYPAEIESVLLTHPKVADVAVLGVPDDDWGEQVKAVVQLKEEHCASDMQAEELLEFCRQQLAGYKIPRSVDFHRELPREPNGKLIKRKLRNEYWVGHERRV